MDDLFKELSRSTFDSPKLHGAVLSVLIQEIMNYLPEQHRHELETACANS